MANYDQSGNPVGNRAPQGGRNGSSVGEGASNLWQGQSGTQPASRPAQHAGQQSPFSGNAQGAVRMQQPGPSGISSRGRFGPDLYSGLGEGPFQLISRLSEEMDRIFEGFGMSGVPRVGSAGRGLQGNVQGAQGLRALWSPHIEIAEREGKLLIQADLPGVRKEDVDVQVEEDAVVIQGHRHRETEHTGQGFYHSERSYGSFHRVIPLPEGANADQANASFRDGVLHIEVPVAQRRERGRRLEIRDATAQGKSAGGAIGGGESSLAAGGSAERDSGSNASAQQHGDSAAAQQEPSSKAAGQQQVEGASERH